MSKKIRRFIGRKIGLFFFKLFNFTTGNISLSTCYAIGSIFGNLFYFFSAKHRKIALESLAIAFPNKSITEIRAIAKESFIMFVQDGLELLCFLNNTQKLANIRIEGREHLDEALKSGRGVVGITAHFGNFSLMFLTLAKLGYPVDIIIRNLRDPDTGQYVLKLCERGGIKVILSYPRREVIGKTIKALRNNEMVMILMDQNSGEGGVWVNFFGKLAATPVGPIVFALRTKSIILPMFIVREGLAKHCIHILPPQELEIKDNVDETIILSAIKLTKIIESRINNHPSHWGWIHRRWKTEPSEKDRTARFKIQGS
jgi:KDO2-lipid IV(A) lauroyltransferase